MSPKAKFIVKFTAQLLASALVIGMFLYNSLSDTPKPTDANNAAARTGEIFGEPSEADDSDGSVFRRAAAAVNINTADEETLCQLDGIGEVKARSIVEYREKNGLFSSVDELINVKGIGEKTLEKIKSKITV